MSENQHGVKIEAESGGMTVYLKAPAHVAADGRLICPASGAPCGCPPDDPGEAFGYYCTRLGR